MNCLLERSGRANTSAVVSTVRTLDHASSVRLKVRMLMLPKTAAWLGSLDKLHLSRNCIMAKCTGSQQLLAGVFSWGPSQEASRRRNGGMVSWEQQVVCPIFIDDA